MRLIVPEQWKNLRVQTNGDPGFDLGLTLQVAEVGGQIEVRERSPWCMSGGVIENSSTRVVVRGEHWSNGRPVEIIYYKPDPTDPTSKWTQTGTLKQSGGMTGPEGTWMADEGP